MPIVVCKMNHSYCHHCVEGLTFTGDNKCPQCREEFFPHVVEHMREKRDKKKKEEMERRELERERETLSRELLRELRERGTQENIGTTQKVHKKKNSIISST